MKKSITIILSIMLVLVLTLSLVGCDLDSFKGDSAYEVAVRNGFEGTEQEWLDSLKGQDGWAGEVVDAYQVAVREGFEGTVTQWLESLKGKAGDDGSTDITITGSENDSQKVAVANALLSTVSINVTHNRRQGTASFAGSGVIYSINKTTGTAYIITNYHVVYYSGSSDANHIASTINVWLYGAQLNTQAISATYVGGSMHYDIAVLKITDNDQIKQSSARSVQIAYDTNVGENVFAVGNPSGEGISATKGILSVDREQIQMTGADDVTAVTFPVMRTDAPINGGNSGGGLYNSEGKLIGIVNAKTVDEEIEGMGYAIPASVAISVADNIIYYCDNQASIFGQRYLLGITTSAQSSKAVYDQATGLVSVVETVYIMDTVASTSLAYGKLQKNDIINSATINNQQSVDIIRFYQLGDMMLSIRQGDTMTLNITRNGENMDVTITFDNAPTQTLA